jgi:glycosyltransferase involved in cell wall biosynthesis
LTAETDSSDPLVEAGTTTGPDAFPVPRPVVSVIVPTYNRGRLLREALASVRALEGPDLIIELIVADNLSTDDTQEVARSFGARVVTATSRGAGAARNAGLEVATGDFVAFLDDDDVWTHEHLRPHIRLMAEQPELGAVIGQIRNTDSEMRKLAAPWPESLPEDGDIVELLFSLQPQIGATVTRRSVADQVGLFDEALLADQDWDWHFRLALTARVGFVPVVSVLFRQRPPGTNDELNRRRQKFVRKVYFRNAKRAGNRGPSLPKLLAIYFSHRGRFCWDFVQNAMLHASVMDAPAARRSFRYAFLSSPVHLIRCLLEDARARKALLLALTGWFRRPRPATA